MRIIKNIINAIKDEISKYKFQGSYKKAAKNIGLYILSVGSFYLYYLLCKHVDAIQISEWVMIVLMIVFIRVVFYTLNIAVVKNEDKTYSFVNKKKLEKINNQDELNQKDSNYEKK
jgi:Ca2+/Na+ antiporter